jgi:hypothetical protein
LLLTDGAHEVNVRVKDLSTKRLDELTEADAQRDGFGSAKELVDELRSFYSNLRSRDILTVIGFVLEESG